MTWLAALILAAPPVWFAGDPKPRKPVPRMAPALASYYSDHGGGACAVGDVQEGYRFANLSLSCGTKVRFCYGSRCVVGMMSDHGPYVGGRLFDLNVNLRYALGCPGLCWLRYAVVR